jgi:hypothetical protein
MLSTATRSRENLLVLLAAAVALSSTEAFGPLHAVPGRQLQDARSTRSLSRSTPFISAKKSALFSQGSSFDFTPSFDDEEEDDDEEEEDDDEEDDDEDDEIRIDPDSLGDWRTFRRNLAATPADTDGETAGMESSNNAEETTTIRKEQPNEKILKAQSEELALEYTGVWAHVTSTVSTFMHCITMYCQHYTVLYCAHASCKECVCCCCCCCCCCALVSYYHTIIRRHELRTPLQYFGTGFCTDLMHTVLSLCPSAFLLSILSLSIYYILTL